MWKAKWLGHIMLSLTTYLGENMVKNYQSNCSANQLCSQKKNYECII